MTSYGASTERTFRYSGILQSDVSGDIEYTFLKELEIVFDDSFVDLDRIDTGTPIFTRVGDEIGTFSFKLSNTVDLYDASSPSSDSTLVTHWIQAIATLPFDEVPFIETMVAPNSIGDKYVRIEATLRIKKVSEVRTENKALEDVIVEGTVIAFTSAQRTES